jgi:hypothetical protein
MREVVEDANVMQGRCGVSTFHSSCTASMYAKNLLMPVRGAGICDFRCTY